MPNLMSLNRIVLLLILLSFVSLIANSTAAADDPFFVHHRLMREAIMKGDRQRVRQLFKTPYISPQDKVSGNVGSWLNFAIDSGNGKTELAVGVIKELVDQGVDINGLGFQRENCVKSCSGEATECQRVGISPLEQAISKRLDLAEPLLDLGANTAVNSPISYAMGHLTNPKSNETVLRIINRLLESPIDPNPTHVIHESLALSVVTIIPNNYESIGLKVVRKYLSAGADPMKRNIFDGMTTIHRMAYATYRDDALTATREVFSSPLAKLNQETCNTPTHRSRTPMEVVQIYQEASPNRPCVLLYNLAKNPSKQRVITYLSNLAQKIVLLPTHAISAGHLINIRYRRAGVTSVIRSTKRNANHLKNHPLTHHLERVHDVCMVRTP
jgi:hypothetical protein